MNEPVIQLLERQKEELRQRYEEQTRSIDLAIAQLRQTSQPAIGIAPGMLAGLELADAMTVALNIRGGKAPVKDLVADLLRGNATIGTQPERRERTVRITITNNKRLFRYQEREDTVELLRK